VDAELFDSSDDYLARAIIEPEDCNICFPADIICEEHKQEMC